MTVVQATTEDPGLQAGEQTPLQASWVKDHLLVALALALTFVAYAGTLGYQFVYDDMSQIISNRFVQSWEFVPRYFTEHVWSFFYPNVPGNYYRPVFLIWVLINHTLFGTDPWGWHLTTLALHIAATYAVYLFALRLTNDRATASISALIFGLHPVHIEAVAWVSGVTEPLLAVLLIPSFLVYLNNREQLESSRKPRRAWLVCSLALYGVAMLAKETALVLPLMIFAYEWIFRRCTRTESDSTLSAVAGYIGRAAAALKCVAPYLVLTAVYLAIRISVLGAMGHPAMKLPLSVIVFTWPSLLWFYIKLLLFPVGLSAFYDTPYISSPGLSNFALPLAGVVGVIAGLWWLTKRSALARFAAVWLALPIFPLLNLSVFSEGEIAHDRYLYLPSVGFAILLAMAVRRFNIGEAKVFGQPATQVLAVLALALLLGAGTSRQHIFWANDLLLYQRGVSVAPGNLLAKNNLAIVLGERGMDDEALGLFHEVLDRNPRFWLSNYNLGFRYYKRGMLEQAEHYLSRAIEINHVDPDQYVYLGLTWMKTGRLNEAESAIRQAIAMRPDAVGYHFALGFILKEKGDLGGAVAEFRAELANNPEQEMARSQINEIEGRLRETGANN